MTELLLLLQTAEQVTWLGQTIEMPLWGFVVALLLPAAYFAGMAKKHIEKYLNGFDEQQTDSERS